MAIIDSGLGWSCDESYYVYDAGTVTYDNPGAFDHFEKTSDGSAIGVNIGYNSGRMYTPWLISTVENNVQSDKSAEVQTAEVNGVLWYKKIAGNGLIGSTSACAFPIVEIPYSREETDISDSAELKDAIRSILEAASATLKPVSEYFKIYRKTNGIWTEIEPIEV